MLLFKYTYRTATLLECVNRGSNPLWSTNNFLMKDLKYLLSNLKSYNLFYEGEALEECDSIYDLFYEIEIVLYNNFLNDVNDVNSKEYLDDIKGYYIEKTNGKVTLAEFIPLIHKGDGQWRMYGDEEFS